MSIRIIIACLLGLGHPVMMFSFIWMIAAAWAGHSSMLDAFFWFCGGLAAGGLAQIIGDWQQ